MLGSCQAASPPATTESSTPAPTVTASVAANTPEPMRDDLDARIASAIPLSRLRLVNGALFLVHEHVAHSYQPGMGAAFATRTTTESSIHCELDAQPNCTEAIAVHVRRCTNSGPGTEDCTDEALRP